MIVDNRSVWSSLKTRTVTVSVKPVQRPEYVFEVSRMINLGAMRGHSVNKRMVFLSPCDWHDIVIGDDRVSRKTPSLYDRVAKINAPENFVMTQKVARPVPSAKSFLEGLFGSGAVGEITQDVLMPGDFVIFRPNNRENEAKLSGALRLIAG
jgi:hypothetical protein